MNCERSSRVSISLLLLNNFQKKWSSANVSMCKVCSLCLRRPQRPFFGKWRRAVTVEVKNNHDLDDSDHFCPSGGPRVPRASTPSSSCYLQGAAVGLLHHHLHVVEDEVEGHAPHRLHRLLHESAGKRSRWDEGNWHNDRMQRGGGGPCRAYLFIYFMIKSNLSRSLSSIKSVQYFTTCRMSSSMGSRMRKMLLSGFLHQHAQLSCLEWMAIRAKIK